MRAGRPVAARRRSRGEFCLDIGPIVGLPVGALRGFAGARRCPRGEGEGAGAAHHL